MKNIERYIHKVVNLSYSGQLVMGLDVNWQGLTILTISGWVSWSRSVRLCGLWKVPCTVELVR